MNPDNPFHLRLGALCFALPGLLTVVGLLLRDLILLPGIASAIWRQAPARTV
jgi:hypothetical protein